MWNNRSVLTGNLTKDPILKKANGKSVCNFRLAVQRQGKDAGADFIDCVAWTQQADYICEYGKKGQQLSLEGRIQSRNYETDGRTVYITEVVVDNCHLGRISKVSSDIFSTDMPDEYVIDEKDLPY